MAINSGFAVQVPALHELSGQLVDLAGRAGQVGEALSGVWADTGRDDSDLAGRLAPGTAAKLISALQGSLHDDSHHVRECAASYADVDAAGASLFGSIQ